MNHELSRLAAAINLDEQRHEAFRLALGLACVQRVEHLLERQRRFAALPSSNRL